MDPCDGSLKLVAPGTLQPRSTIESTQRRRDLLPIPAAPILILEKHQLSRVVDARFCSSTLQKHQREEPECLRLARHELYQPAGETDRLRTQVAADERITGGCAVTLV